MNVVFAARQMEVGPAVVQSWERGSRREDGDLRWRVWGEEEELLGGMYPLRSVIWWGVERGGRGLEEDSGAEDVK